MIQRDDLRLFVFVEDVLLPDDIAACVNAVATLKVLIGWLEPDEVAALFEAGLLGLRTRLDVGNTAGQTDLDLDLINAGFLVELWFNLKLFLCRRPAFVLSTDGQHDGLALAGLDDIHERVVIVGLLAVYF